MPAEFFIFITAILFTGLGYMFGRKDTTRTVVEITVAHTIDSLIKNGYIKTRGTGPNLTLIKVKDYDQTP